MNSSPIFLPAGTTLLREIPDSLPLSDLLLTALEDQELKTRLLMQEQSDSNKIWIISNSPGPYNQFLPDREGVLITTHEKGELESVLQQVDDESLSVTTLVVAPTKQQTNTLFETLKPRRSVSTRFIVIQKCVSLSHFVEIRQAIQKVVPNRHLHRISCFERVATLKVLTARKKQYTAIIFTLDVDGNTRQNITLGVGTRSDCLSEDANSSFLQLRVSKLVMKDARHISPMPLPFHKMQQRPNIVQVQYNSEVSEVKTFALNALNLEEKSIINDWINEIREAHGSVDPDQESDQVFLHLWYDPADNSRRLHQMTSLTPFNIASKSVLARYQALQLNSYQYIANLLTADYEKLEHTLLKTSAKLTCDPHTGTMSFGYKKNLLFLAMRPGGLAFVPVTLTFKHEHGGLHSPLVQAAIAAHSLEQPLLLPNGGAQNQLQVIARAPNDADHASLFGHHQIQGFGEYLISATEELRLPTWNTNTAILLSFPLPVFKLRILTQM